MTHTCWTFEGSTAVIPDRLTGEIVLKSAYLCSAFPSSSSTLKKSVSSATESKREKISRNIINVLSKRSHQSRYYVSSKGVRSCMEQKRTEIRYFGRRQPCVWCRKLVTSYSATSSRSSVSDQTWYVRGLLFTFPREKKPCQNLLVAVLLEVAHCCFLRDDSWLKECILLSVFYRSHLCNGMGTRFVWYLYVEKNQKGVGAWAIFLKPCSKILWLIIS